MKYSKNIKRRYHKKRKGIKASLIGLCAALLFLLIMIPFQNPEDFSLSDFGRPDIFATDSVTSDTLNSSNSGNTTDDATEDSTTKSEDLSDDTSGTSVTKDKDTSTDADTGSSTKDDSSSQNSTANTESQNLQEDVPGQVLLSNDNPNPTNEDDGTPETWDFSKNYAGQEVTLTASETSPVSEVYGAKGSLTHRSDIATVTMYGPNVNGVDASSIDSSGFCSNYAYLDSNKNVKGSYIEIRTGSNKLESLDISLKTPSSTTSWTEQSGYWSSKTYTLYHIFCLSKALKWDDDNRVDNISNEYSNKEITLTLNSLEANTTYYLFSFNDTVNNGYPKFTYHSNTSYASTGGMIVKKIEAKLPPSNISGKISGSEINIKSDMNAKLIFQPQSSSQNYSTSFTLTAGQSEDFDLGELPKGIVGDFYVEINGIKYKVRENYTIPNNDVTDLDIDISSCFATITGTIFNKTGTNRGFYLSYNDSKSSIIAVDNNSSKTFTWKGVFKNTSNELFIKSDNTSDDLNENDELSKSVLISNAADTNVGIIEFSSDVKLSVLNNDNHPNAVTFSYFIKKYTAGVETEETKTLEREDEYVLQSNSRLSYILDASKNNLVNNGTNITLTNPFIISDDMTVRIDGAEYVWEEYTQNDKTYWKCTGYSPNKTSYTVTEICDEAVSGAVTRIVTKQPTMYSEGAAELTANFTKSDYFVKISKTISLPKSDKHEHDGITFDDPWTDSTKLPSSGSYYLETDVLMTSGITVSSGSTLKICLNGHSIKWNSTSQTTMITNNGTLYLCDCEETQYLYPHYFDSNFSLLADSTNASYTCYGGVITGGTKHVVVNSKKATFNTYHVGYIGNKNTDGQDTSGTGGKDPELSKGSAILCYESSNLNVDGCKFWGNTTQWWPNFSTAQLLGGYGAAIAMGPFGAKSLSSGCSGVVATIANSDIRFNKAERAGAMYFGTKSNVTIDNCNISDNWAFWSGGAIFESLANVTYIDTQIINNSIGPFSGKRNGSTYGWGAGLVVNQNSYSEGDSSTIKFGGKIVIQNNINYNNMSVMYTSPAEDNLCLEGSESSGSLKNPKIEFFPVGDKNAYDSSSSVGVNVFKWSGTQKPYEGIVTSGYPQYKTAWLGLKTFTADNILDPDKYSVVLTNTLEVKLTSHNHIYNYSAIDSINLDKPQDINTSDSDTLKFWCTQKNTICAYNSPDGTPIECPLKFEDGTLAVYDGTSHAATMDNDAFTQLYSKTGTKLVKNTYFSSVSSETSYNSSNSTINPSEGIVYFKQKADGNWEQISGVPTEHGVYKAKAKFFCFEGVSKSAPAKLVEIISDNFTIGKKQIYLQLDCKDKPFDNSSYVSDFNGYTLQGLDADDDVTIDITGLTCALKDDEKYVGTYYLDHIVSDVTLQGTDADKYELMGVTASPVKITPIDNDFTRSSTENWSMYAGEGENAEVRSFTEIYPKLWSNKDTTVVWHDHSTAGDGDTLYNGEYSGKGSRSGLNNPAKGLIDTDKSETDNKGLVYRAPDSVTSNTIGYIDNDGNPPRTRVWGYIDWISSVDLNGDGIEEIKATVNPKKTDFWINILQRPADIVTVIFEDNGVLPGESISSYDTISAYKNSKLYFNNNAVHIAEASGIGSSFRNPGEKVKDAYKLTKWTYREEGTDEKDLTTNKVTLSAGKTYIVKAYVEKIPTNPSINITSFTSRTYDSAGNEKVETKTVDGATVTVPSTPDLNDIVTYDFVVENNGDMVLYRPVIKLRTNSGLEPLQINLSDYGKDTLSPGEKFSFSYEDIKSQLSSISDFDYKHIVTESNICDGSLSGTLNVSAEKAAETGSESVESEKSLNIDLADIDTSKVDISVQCSKGTDEVLIGDEVTYTITVTNNSNITMTSGVVVDELIGATGANAFSVPQLAPGQSYTITTNKYTITELKGKTAVDNTAKLTGLFKAKEGATDQTVYKDDTCSNPYGYKTINKPTAKTGLEYNGSSQEGVDVVSTEGIDWAEGSENSGIDAGTYTAKVKKGTWYKWSDGDTRSEVPITWTIGKATLTVSDINGASNVNAKKTYDGDELTYNLRLKDSTAGTSEVVASPEGAAITGFVSSMKLVTNTANVNNYQSVGSANNQCTLNTEFLPDSNWNQTKFDNNYTIEFNGINLIIEPKTFTDNDKIDVEATSYTYNTEEHTTFVSVVDTEIGTGGTTLIKGTDYEIDSTSILKATTYLKDGYKVTVNGKGNYSGSKFTFWMINKAPISLEITGASASKVYNKNQQSIYGCSVTGQTLSDGITLDESLISPKITDDTSNAECVSFGTDVGGYATQKKTGTGTAATYEPLTQGMFAYDDPNIDATFTFNAGQLEITEKSISSSDITITPKDKYTYNGSEQTFEFIVKDGDTELQINRDYTIKTDTDKGTNANTYTLIIDGNGNYSGEKTYEWTIDKADFEIKMTDELVAKATKVFDGQALSFDFEQNGLGKDVFSVNVLSNDYIATTYTGKGGATEKTKNTVSVSAKTGTSTNLNNYKDFTYGKIQTSITKRNLTLSAKDRTCTYTLDSDRNPVPQELLDSEVSYNNELHEDVSWVSDAWVNKSRANAGWQDGYIDASKISVSMLINDTQTDVTNNYNITSNSAKLTVEEREIKVKVKGSIFDDSQKYTYNGSTFEFSSADTQMYVSTLLSDDTLLYFDASKVVLKDLAKPITVSGKNAGTYNLQYDGKDLDVNAFVYDDTNVKVSEWQFENGHLDISKKDIDIAGTGAHKHNDQPFTYTLIDSTQPNSDITGAVSGEKIGGTVVTNSPNIGTYLSEGTGSNQYQLNLSFENGALESNYKISSVTTALSISEEITFNIVGTQIGLAGDVYYDGQLHEAKGFTVSCSDATEKNNIKLKEAYSGKDSVKATDVTRDADGNIAAHYMQLSKDCFEYTGSAEFVVINYVDGGIKIKPRPLSKEMVTATNTSQVFNNKTLSPTYTLSYSVTTESGPVTVTLTPEKDYELSNNTGIDSHKYYTEIEGKGNYTGMLTSENTDGKLIWEITPAPITIHIKGHVETATYDGKEHISKTYEPSCTQTTPFYSDSGISPASGDESLKVARTVKGTSERKLSAADFVYNDPYAATVEDGKKIPNVVATFVIDQDIQVSIGTKSLTDKSLTASLNPTEFTYKEGVVQAPTLTVKDGDVDLISTGQARVKSNGSVTSAMNVGEYTIIIEPTENSNYVDTIELHWKITPLNLNVVITPKTEELTFDGAEHTVKGFSAKKDSGTSDLKESYITYNGADSVTGTNVNTYTQLLDITKFGYSDTNVNTTFTFAKDGEKTLNIVTLVINPKAINTDGVVITKGDTVYTYDASQHGVSISIKYIKSGKTLVLGTDYKIEGIQYATDANSYQFVISGLGNFSGTYKVDWVINQADVEISISGNTLATTYDGTQKSVTGYSGKRISGSTLFDDSKLLPVKSSFAASGTDAGTYDLELPKANSGDWSYSDKNLNVQIKSVTNGWLKINPRDISTGDYELFAQDLTYNGSEQTTSTSVKLKNSETGTLSSDDYKVTSGDKATYFGTYTVKVEGTGNYKGSLSTTWNMAKKTVKFIVSGRSENKTYNNQVYTAAGMDISVPESSDLVSTANVNYDGKSANISPSVSMTDAGQDSVSIDVNKLSYTDSTNSISPVFEVDTAKPSVTVDVDAKPITIFVSDRMLFSDKYFTHNITSSEVVGLCTGHALNNSSLKTRGKAVGEYNKLSDSEVDGFEEHLDFTDAGGKKGNYSITYKVSLIIYANDVYEIYITGHNDTITYDGQSHTVSGYDKSASWGYDESKLSLKLASSNKDRISQKDVVYDDDGNVSQYQMGLTADDFEYTGTDVPSGKTLVIHVVDGFLKINPKSISDSSVQINASANEFTYDGYEKNPGITVKDTSIGTNGTILLAGTENNVKDYNITNATAIDADTYTSVITGTGNYYGVLSSAVVWKIKQKPLSIYFNDTKPYDKTRFSLDFPIASESSTSATVTFNSLAKDEVLSGKIVSNSALPNKYYKNDTEGTSAGLDKDGYTIQNLQISGGIGTHTAKLSNYDISYDSSSALTITKKQIEVTPANKTVTYNGQPQQLDAGNVSITGLNDGDTVNPDSIVFSPSSQTLQGTYSVQVNSFVVKDNSSLQNDVTTCYDPVWKTATLQIDKYAMKINVSGSAISCTYDGEEHELNETTGSITASEVIEAGKSNSGLFDSTKVKHTGVVSVTGVNADKYTLDLSKCGYYYDDDNIDVTWSYVNPEMTINPKSIEGYSMSATSFTYNKKDHVTSVTLKDADEKELASSNFQVVNETVGETTYTDRATKADTYNVKVKGVGNYTGTNSCTWVINKQEIIVLITGQTKTETYTGMPITFPSGLDKAYALDEGKDESGNKTNLFDSKDVVCSKSSYAITQTVVNYDGDGKVAPYYMGISKDDFTYSDTSINATFKLVNDGSLTITPLNISDFKAEAAPTTYNKKVQNANVAVEKGLMKLDPDNDFYLTGDYSKKDANTSGYKLNVVGKGNFTGSINDVNWIINKAVFNIEVNGFSDEQFYTREAHVVEGFNVTKVTGTNTDMYAYGDIQFDRNSRKAGKISKVNAGSYTADIYASDFAYKDLSCDVSFVAASLGGLSLNGETVIATNKLKIKPVEIVLNPNKSKSKVIDTPFTYTLTNEDQTGLVSGDSLSGTLTTTGFAEGEYKNNNLIVDLKINDIPIPSTYTDTVNYYYTNKAILTITSMQVLKIKWNGNTTTYDGQKHSLNSDNYVIDHSGVQNYDPKKLVITKGPEITDVVNAGTYTTTHQVEYQTESWEAKVYVEIEQATLLINQRNLSSAGVDISLPAESYEYDGETHIPDGSAVTISDSAVPSTTVVADTTQALPTEAVVPGNYDVVYTASTDGNYTGTKKKTYTINNAKRLIKISGNTGTKPYDSTALTVDGYQIDELTLDGKAPTKEIIDTTAITPASESFSVSQTNVGKNVMGIGSKTFAYSGANKNYIDYQWQQIDGYAEITKPKITTLTLSSKEFTYNKASQGPSAEVKDENGRTLIEGQDYEISGNMSETNANTTAKPNYTLTITGINNYVPTASIKNVLSDTWVIKQAERTVDVVGNFVSKEFDGSPAVAKGYKLTEDAEDKIVEMGKITFSGTAQASQTNVGASYMNLAASQFGYSDSSNIAVTFNITDGYAQVTQKDINDINITPGKTSFVYNMQDQKPSPKLVNGTLPLAENTDYVLEVTDKDGKTLGAGEYKNVDSYILVIKAKEGGNYEDKGKPYLINYDITKCYITVDIKGSTYSPTYNKKEHKSTYDPTAAGALTASETWFKPEWVKATDGASWSVLGTNVFHTDALGNKLSVYNVGLSNGSFKYTDDENGNTVTTFDVKSDQQLQILQKSINDSTVKIKVENVDYCGFYTGAKVTVKDEADPVSTLEKGVDYTENNNSQLTAGDYKLTLTGIENYCDTTSDFDWQILQAQVKVKIVGYNETLTYNGQEQSTGGFSAEAVEGSDVSKGLFSADNIVVSSDKIVAKGTNVGTYYMSLFKEVKDEHGNISYVPDVSYKDTNLKVEFLSTKDKSETGYLKIDPLRLDDASVEYSLTNPFFNGEDQLPPIEIRIKAKNGTYAKVDQSQVKIADTYKRTHVAEPVSPTEEGKYTLVVERNSDNFVIDSSKSLDWKILPRDVVVTKNGSGTHTGNPLQVSFTQDDFSWHHSSHTIEGTITTKSSDVGLYTSAKSGDLEYDVSSWKINGIERPELARDYSLSYNSELAIGVKLISDCYVEYTDHLEYSGENKKPTDIKVYSDIGKTTQLVDGTDYTVDIVEKKNANVGSDKYTFVVNGIGKNYSGTKTCYWTIIPKAATIKPYVDVSDNGRHDFEYSGNNNKQNYNITLDCDPDGTTPFAQSDFGGVFTDKGDQFKAVMKTISTASNSYGTDAGTYTLTGADNRISIAIADVTAVGQSLVSNYAFTVAPTSQLKISKKEVEVHAQKSTTYNGNKFAYTFDSTQNLDDTSPTKESKDISGVVFGERIYGTLTTNGSDAGTYSGIGAGDNQLTRDDPHGGDGTKVENYDIKYNNNALTIERASLKITCKVSREFDGTALSIGYPSDKVQITGLASGEGFEGTLATSIDGTSGNGTHAGVYKSSNITGDYRVYKSTPAPKPGTSTKEANYKMDFIEYDVELTIKPKQVIKKDYDVTPKVEGFYVEMPELVYNGKDQAPNDNSEEFKVYDSRMSTTTPLSSDTDYVVTCTRQINANIDTKYSFTIIGKEGSNYATDKSISFDWIIKPKSVELLPNRTAKTPGEASRIYNGEQISYEIQKSDANEHVLDEIITGNIVTNEVRASEGKTTSSGTDVKYTFAGMKDTQERLYKLNTQNIKVVNGQQKLSNYTLTFSDTAAFTINKRTAKLTVSDARQYNGKRFTRAFNGNNFGETTNEQLFNFVNEYGADKTYAKVDYINDTSTLVEGEEFTGTLTSGTNEDEGKNVGDYELNTASGKVQIALQPGPTASAHTDAANYNFDYNVLLSITPQSLSQISVIDNNDYTYTGNEMSPGDESHPLQIFDPITNDYLIPYDSSTGIGDYEIVAEKKTNVPDSESGEKYTYKIVGKNNYDGSYSDDIAWTIKPANLTVYATDTNQKSKVYDGQCLTYSLDTAKTSTDASGLVGGDILKGTFQTSAKDVGSYYFGSADLSVNVLNLDIFKKDGKTPVPDRNYKIVYSGGSVPSGTNLYFSISTKPIHIKFADSKPYDGVNYSKQISSIEEDKQTTYFDGVVGGENLQAVVSSTGSNVGTYTSANNTAKVSALAVASDDVTTKLSNYTYESTKDNVEISISHQDISKLLVAEYNNTLIYNGKEQIPSVNGVKLNDGTELNIKDFTISGEPQKHVSESAKEYPYSFTISALESSNYSGSITCEWKIAPREVTIAPKSPKGGIPYMDYVRDDYKFEYLVDTDVRVDDVQNSIAGERLFGTFTSISGVPGSYGYDDDYPNKTIDTAGIKFGDGVKSSDYKISYHVWLQIDHVSINNEHITIETTDDPIYNGKTQTLDPGNIVVKYYGYTLEQGTDYEIVSIAPGEDVGSYKIEIKGKDVFVIPGKEDEINDSGRWNIVERQVIVSVNDSKDFNNEPLNKTYSNTEIFDYTDGIKGKPLSEIIDSASTKASFEGGIATSKDGVSANGVNAGSYLSSNTSGDFMICSVQDPKAMHQDTKMKNYLFADSSGNVRYDCKLDIIAKSIGGSDLDIVITNPEYDGTSQNPDIVITDNTTGQELKVDDGHGNGDYKLSDSKTDAGDYIVEITGENNYKEKIDKPWSITARRIALCVNDSKVYDKNALIRTATEADFKHVDKAGKFDTKLALVGSQRVSGVVETDGVNAGDYAYSTDASINKVKETGPVFDAESGAKASNYEVVRGSYDVLLVINKADIKDAEVTLGDMVIYDPDKPQKQKQDISSVELRDLTLEPSVDYSVADNEGLEPGVYHMILSGDGNYTGTKSVTWVIVGTTDEDIAKIGNITIEVKNDSTSPSGSIDTSRADIVKMLSDANELSKVADGDELNIWLQITDTNATIATERPQAKSALDFVASQEGEDVASYNDISLFKKLASEEFATQLHSTKKPLELTLNIPDWLKPGTDISKRVFGLIRHHVSADEGSTTETKKLDTNYDEQSFELEFVSDKFSDYAITKIDTLAPSPKPDEEQTPAEFLSATWDKCGQQIIAFFAVAVIAAVFIGAARRWKKFNKR